MSNRRYSLIGDLNHRSGVVVIPRGQMFNGDVGTLSQSKTPKPVTTSEGLAGTTSRLVNSGRATLSNQRQVANDEGSRCCYRRVEKGQDCRGC